MSSALPQKKLSFSTTNQLEWKISRFNVIQNSFIDSQSNETSEESLIWLYPTADSSNKKICYFTTFFPFVDETTQKVIKLNEYHRVSQSRVVVPNLTNGEQVRKSKRALYKNYLEKFTFNSCHTKRNSHYFILICNWQSLENVVPPQTILNKQGECTLCTVHWWWALHIGRASNLFQLYIFRWIVSIAFFISLTNETYVDCTEWK